MGFMEGGRLAMDRHPHSSKNVKGRFRQHRKFSVGSPKILRASILSVIRTLGAGIRTSLVCEGSLNVMSFKMVDC